MRRSIWLIGFRTAFFAVLGAGALASSLAGGGGSSSTTRTNAAVITSDEAVAMVKAWIGGGTQSEAVAELLDDLICSAYYETSGIWDVRCRLPWVPTESYFFRVVEVPGEVTAKTEATLAFVRL